jgi:hypothetical protein
VLIAPQGRNSEAAVSTLVEQGDDEMVTGPTAGVVSQNQRLAAPCRLAYREERIRAIMDDVDGIDELE